EGLGNGRAREQADGVAFGEAVEAVGLAAGSDVQVDVVGGGGGGDEGVLLVLAAQGVKLIDDALVGSETGLEPADGAAGRLHLDEAAIMLEDLELLSVGDLAHAVGDSGDAVAQDALLGDHVDVLGLTVRMEATAAGGGEQSAERRCDEQTARPRMLSAGDRGQMRTRRHVCAKFLGGLKKAGGGASDSKQELQGSQATFRYPRWWRA